MRILLAAMCFFGLVFFYAISSDLFVFLALSATFFAFVLVVIVFYDRVAEHRLRRSTKRNYQNTQQDLLHIKTVFAERSGLQTTSKRGKGIFYWKTVSLFETDVHVFLYVNSIPALVIPKRRHP